MIARGLIRFEVMLRRDRLTSAWARNERAIIRQVGDIEQDKLDSLASRMVEDLLLADPIPDRVRPERRYIIDWRTRRIDGFVPAGQASRLSA
jgi:hypothetical protein